MATLEFCFVSSDVYFVCMHHALSTEVEEIMGLLIGYTDDVKHHCHITHNLLLKRLDKRKDRVEISPESLAGAITECDELNSARLKNLGKAEHEALPELRVVGWYHSHPHITVFPSEVDLRTQLQYQTGVDRTWIGLIFGVYNAEENTGLNKFQYIAFQTVQKDHTSRMVQSLIPVVIEPKITPSPQRPLPDVNSLKNLEKSLAILFHEEYEAYAKKKVEIEADYLASLQNVSTFSKNICKIVKRLGAPMLEVLQNSMLADVCNNNCQNKNVTENGLNAAGCGRFSSR